MPRRQQVEYRPPTANLEPVAAPTPRPFAPRLGPETILPVSEFAGLSKILGKISVEQAERQADVDREAGWNEDQTAPLDAVDAVAEAAAQQDRASGDVKANQKAFARAEQKGEVTAAQNPWNTVGHVESSAHRLMLGYAAKLDAAMSAATATSDANGDPLLPQDLDKVVAGVWKEYADNPVLKNYYGSKVARQMKSAADAQFVNQASAQRAENQVRDTIHWQTNALADKLFAGAMAGEAPDEATWGTVRAWSADLYAKTGGQAKTGKVILAAGDSLATRLDAADTGESGVSKAAQALRALRDAPVGGTTLGKDAETGPQLEAMIAKYDQDFKTKQDNLGRAEAQEDARAVNTGRREYLELLRKDRENGPADPVAVKAKYMDEHGAQFGLRRGLVDDELEQLSLATGAQHGKAMAGQILQQLELDGDADRAMYTARVSVSELGLDQFDKIQKAAEERKSLRPFIEASPLDQARQSEVEKASVVPGVPEHLRGEIGVQVSAQNDALVADYNARKVEAFKGIAALPAEQQDGAQRAWYAENQGPLREKLQANGLAWAKERADARAQVQELIARKSDPSAVVSGHPDVFSTDEQEKIRALTIDALNREPMLGSPGFLAADKFLVQRLQETLKDQPNQADTIETAQREFRSRFLDALGGELPNTEPAQQDALVRRVADEQAVEVLQRAATTRVPSLTEAVQPGAEGVPARNELIDAAEEDKAAGREAIATASREDFGRAIPPNTNERVSDALKSLQVAYAGGGTDSSLPFFGAFQTVGRDEVLTRAFGEAKAVAANPTLSPKEKAQAVVDMNRYTGLTLEDLAAGQITVRPPAAWIAKVQEWADHPNRIGSAPRLQAELKKTLAEPPVVLPLQGVKVNPYTTPLARSADEFRLFAETRKEDLRKILKTYAGVDTDEALNEFGRIQMALINRYNAQ